MGPPPSIASSSSAVKTYEPKLPILERLRERVYRNAQPPLSDVPVNVPIQSTYSSQNSNTGFVTQSSSVLQGDESIKVVNGKSWMLSGVSEGKPGVNKLNYSAADLKTLAEGMGIPRARSMLKKELVEAIRSRW